MTLYKKRKLYFISIALVFLSMILLCITQINIQKTYAEENDKPTSITLQYSAKDMMSLPVFKATMSYPMTIHSNDPNMYHFYNVTLDADRTEDYSKMCDGCDSGDLVQNTKFEGKYEIETGRIMGDLTHTYSVSIEPKRISDSEYQYGTRSNYSVTTKIDIIMSEDFHTFTGKAKGGTSLLKNEFFGDSGDGHTPEPTEQSWPVDWDITGTASYQPIKTSETTKKEPELVIDKAVGDISYSDAKRPSSVLTAMWRYATNLAKKKDEEIWRKWQQPKVGTILTEDSRIKTEMGMAKITMKDGSKFILRRGSEIRILKGGGIHILKGSGYFVYPKTGKNKEIKANNYGIRIRGTEFSILVKDDTGVIKLVEGELEIDPPGDKESVTLKTGESLNFNNEGEHEKGTFSTEEEKEEWKRIESESPENVTSKISEPILFPLIVFLIIIGGILWIVIRIKNKYQKRIDDIEKKEF